MAADFLKMKKYLFLTWALGAACAALAQQPYPSRPIQIVVTAAPGSSADILARIFGDEWGRQLGQPVLVDNRPGAGGNIAAELVARAKPDGYTVLLASTSTHGINPSLYASMRFDPVKDFAPISRLASSPNVLVVPAASPAQSIKDLVAIAKSKPGELSYSSGGSGTSQHLAGEMFAAATGTKLLHVPYKSAPQSMNAVLAGEVNMSFVSVPVALAQAKSRSVKALGVTSLEAVSTWPELPTIASQGLPGFNVSAWFGLAAPAGTPPAVIERLATSAHKVLGLPAIKSKLQDQGMEVVSDTPTEFSAFIKSEIVRWGNVVKASGAKLE